MRIDDDMVRITDITQSKPIFNPLMGSDDGDNSDDNKSDD